MCLQGENHLACAMFQTITAFKMKLELWQAQIMGKNFKHFKSLSGLAEHSPVNSKKNAALLSVLIKEYIRIEFKIGEKKNLRFFGVFATPV